MNNERDQNVCPICGGKLIDDEVRGRKFKRCLNQECIVEIRKKQLDEIEKGRKSKFAPG